MRILFLDDDPNRTREFRRKMIGNSVTCVETPEQAIAALNTMGRFDIASLDHDLYGKVYQPSDENSGFAVCQHIRQMDDFALPFKVFCHSFNPDGVANMMTELEHIWDKFVNFGAIPFGSDEYWKQFDAVQTAKTATAAHTT